MEIWKDIKGYEGLYQVSNQGNVKTLGRGFWRDGRKIFRNEKILKPSVNSGGYKRVALCNYDGKLEYFLVHRLVATTFLSESSKPYVNHIDGNKLNCHIDNLEFCTPLENTHHAMRLGLFTGRPSIDSDKIETALAMHDSGNFTVKEIIKQTGISQGSLYRAINKRKAQ